jgi:hypothetical protein
MTRFLLLGAFLLLPLLVACQAFGFPQRTGDNELSLRYQTFTAAEEKQVTLQAGDTLVLSYDVVATKGTLTVSVLDPAGTSVWEITLRADGSDRVRIPIAESGTYTIRFEGKDTGGRTELSWKIER